jgi:hypothetical protein
VALPDWAPGEDRSNFQAIRHWEGNDFGATKFTEATGFRDPTAAPNWDRLAEEGKPRLGYHFFHPAISPVSQAHFFAEFAHSLGLKPGDGLYADAEITVGGAGGGWVAAPHAYRRMHMPSLLERMPPAAHVGVVANSLRIFMETLETLVDPAKHPLLIYTDGSIAATLGSCTRYGLFIAWYGGRPPEVVAPWTRPWVFWQVEAGGGPGGGDKDFFHGGRAKLHEWLAPYRGESPSPQHLASKTGDEMFYLVTGKGAETPLDIPPGASELHLTTTAPATVEVLLDDHGWTEHQIDYNRSPAAIPLHGATRGKARRADAGTHHVTGSFV